MRALLLTLLITAAPAQAQERTLMSHTGVWWRPGALSPDTTKPEAQTTPAAAPTIGDRDGVLAALAEAVVALNAARLDEAEAVSARLLAQVEAGGDTDLLIRALHVRAMIQDARGDYAGAEASARRGVAYGQDDWAVALQTSLGSALYEQGRYAEALAAYRLVADAVDAGGGLADDRANALMNMGIIRSEQGRWREGEALYRSALTATEADPMRRVIAANLAWNLHEQRRYAEAEPLLRQAVEDMHAIETAPSRNIAAAVTNLAGDLQAQGRHAEALPLFRQALSMFDQVIGRDHPQAGWTLNALAASLEATEGPAAAEPLLREAATVSTTRLPPGHPEANRLTADLAALYVRDRRPGEALPLLRQAAARARARTTGGASRHEGDGDGYRRLHQISVQAAWSAAGV